jgi:hypothetical protein
MISVLPSPSRHHLFDEPLEKLGVHPNIVLHSEEVHSFIPAVQSGVASALIWLPLCESASNVEIRHFDPPRMTQTGFLYLPTASQAAMELLSLVLDIGDGSRADQRS